jgi:hypothetical protein
MVLERFVGYANFVIRVNKFTSEGLKGKIYPGKIFWRYIDLVKFREMNQKLYLKSFLN